MSTIFDMSVRVPATAFDDRETWSSTPMTTRFSAYCGCFTMRWTCPDIWRSA